jgi:hypothetical protein
MAKKRKYCCRHCGKKFNSYYMAEICFELDMKILNKPKKDGKDKKTTGRI